ncbi:hypothetical protein JZ751_016630 [Albula glossodonta]|uniref:Exocyst complex component Sec3 coiled-coil domain-containing protein n=1 Tax=Albula glossodonta TaxID=121402 RepID=A0A8T2N2I2_9TELE|nr:hypothetical protein JZ751_016630 [Albula glossodonta]
MLVLSCWKELSAREEQDIEGMMEVCEYAISNAEAFAEKLSRELQVLDGANIQSIMASEKQVNTLMQLLDEALAEVDTIEGKLSSYEEMLQSVKEQMDQISQSNRHEKLLAVKQQQHLFCELRDGFSRRLTNHLNNVFVHQGHDQSSSLNQHCAELTLPKHSVLHRDLLRYSKLMEWLKNTQREKYEGLTGVSAFLPIIIIIIIITNRLYHNSLIQ